MTLSTGPRWLLLWPLVAWAAPYAPNEPPVEPDSAAIRAVLQEPVASGSPFPLFVARAKLDIAGDKGAAAAIDAYLTAIALSRLTGSAVDPRATVGEIVQRPIANESFGAQIGQVLASTLRAESPRADDEKQAVVVALRNVGSHRVTQFDANLEIRLPQGDPITLRCHEPRFTLTPIDPGGSVVHECGHVSQFAGIKAALVDPTAARLMVDRINFEDPDVSITSRGALWLDRGHGVGGPYAALEKARADLRALPCGDRNACGEEFQRMLGRHPLVLITGVFAAIGAVMGTLIALFARRRWMWGLGLAGLLAAAVAGAIGYLFAKNSLVGLLLLFAGPVAVLGFLLGLVPALALVRRSE